MFYDKQGNSDLKTVCKVSGIVRKQIRPHREGVEHAICFAEFILNELSFPYHLVQTWQPSKVQHASRLVPGSCHKGMTTVPAGCAG